MAETNLTNFHYGYMDMIRHWHADSEDYTGGDALFTALSEGWQLGETVRFQECWLMGGRFVVVYYLELGLKDEAMTMPVINNPYVQRLIDSGSLKLVAMDDKKVKPPVKR